MNHSQENNLDQLSSDIKDIHHALLGNPLLNDGGLVGRVTTVEQELKKVSLTQSHWRSFLAGMAFLVGVAGSLFGWLVATIWTKHT